MMGNGFGFGFGIPGLGMFVVWGLIIALVVWLGRAIAGALPSGSKGARQILDERFARGEIDRREYEEKRQMIN